MREYQIMAMIHSFILETIGPKTVSALLRQNATIEPVDTSRGVGKHLVSLLTTASRETSTILYFLSSLNAFVFLPLIGYKQPTRDAVIEERYKVKFILSSSSIENLSFSFFLLRN